MSDIAECNIVVLWESELRAAAVALDAMDNALRSSKSLKDTEQLFRAALEASFAALHGLSKYPDAHVVVCSGDRLRFVPRVTEIVKGEKTEGSK